MKTWAIPNPGAQTDFLSDWQTPSVAFIGGWGSGKTWAGARKLLAGHIANAVDEHGKPTGVKSLCVAPTYGLAATINVPAIIQAAEEIGLTLEFVADMKRYWFRVPEFGPDSLIYIRSADNPKLIAGFEAGYVWRDESALFYRSDGDASEDGILQSAARLRANCRFRQSIDTSTHQGENSRLFDLFEKNPVANRRIYRASTLSNAANLPAPYVEEIRSMISAELAKQYIDGYSVNLAGNRVYDQFSQENVAKQTIPFDQTLPLMISFDFNRTPGSHAVICQWNRDRQEFRAIMEIFETGAGPRRLCEVATRTIKARTGALPKINPPPNYDWPFPGRLDIYGDATGAREELDGTKSWEEIQAEMRASGIPFQLVNVPKSNPPVSDRVVAVNAALRSADGRRRLLIDPSCTRLLADMANLRWDGNSIDKHDRKLSHASDALGYCLHQQMPVHSRRAA